MPTIKLKDMLSDFQAIDEFKARKSKEQERGKLNQLSQQAFGGSQSAVQEMAGIDPQLAMKFKDWLSKAPPEHLKQASDNVEAFAGGLLGIDNSEDFDAFVEHYSQHDPSFAQYMGKFDQKGQIINQALGIKEAVRKQIAEQKMAQKNMPAPSMPPTPQKTREMLNAEAAGLEAGSPAYKNFVMGIKNQALPTAQDPGVMTPPGAPPQDPLSSVTSENYKAPASQKALVDAYGKPTYGHRWRADGSQEVIEGSSAEAAQERQDRYTPNVAQTLADMEMAAKDLEVAKAGLFTNYKEGSKTPLKPGVNQYSFGKAAQSMIPRNRAFDAKRAIYRTVDIILRIRSGAATPEPEVARFADYFTPDLLDSEQGARDKIERLESFFNEVKAYSASGRKGPMPAVPGLETKEAPVKKDDPLEYRGTQ